jgi:hypothetical protein
VHGGHVIVGIGREVVLVQHVVNRHNEPPLRSGRMPPV